MTHAPHEFRTAAARGTRARGMLPLLAALVCFALAGCGTGRTSRLAAQDADAAFETYGFAVRFSGTLHAQPEDLEEVIDDQLNDYASNDLRRAFVDDAAYVLENHLRALGYAFARVDYDVDPTPRGNWVTFTVDAGPRVEVGELRFEEARDLDLDTVRALFDFKLAEGGGPPLFSESALRGGASALIDLYLSKGYLDANVDTSDVRFSADRSRANMVVRVAAGPRYIVQGVLIDGVPESESSRVGPVLERSLGQPFTPRLAFELRNRLLEWYGDRGFAEVSVNVERDLDTESGAVLLRYTVTKGASIVIAGVETEGLRKTRRSVIKDRLRMGRGDPFRRERMRESFARLYQTALFERVGLSLAPAPEDHGLELAPGEEARILKVEVEELPSQELFVEPGYGSYEQFRARIGYRERNLLGTGRGFRAEATAALLALRAEIGLTDNTFIFDNLRADFAVRGNERQEPSFTRQEIGFASSFTWPLAPNVENTVTYGFKRSRIFDIDVIDALVEDELATVDISSVLVSIRYDTRNDLFVPSEGWLLRGGVEVGDNAIGSDLDFMRLNVGSAHFVSLDSDGDTVLALAAESGAIVPHGQSDAIPLQERYFLGGERNVRAFKESKLGPADAEGNPVGGEAFTLFSAELRQRLVGKLQGALFFDAGNVLLDYNDWSSFEQFRWGVGTGVRYVLPVGPLRLDLGWNPEATSAESELILHFSLGMSF